MQQSRTALALGALSFLVVPISYSWVLFPGEDPSWLAPLIAVSEWGGLACAVAAIWLGGRARMAGGTSFAATWAPRIGVATVAVYLVMLLALATLYR